MDDAHNANCAMFDPCGQFCDCTLPQRRRAERERRQFALGFATAIEAAASLVGSPLVRAGVTPAELAIEIRRLVPPVRGAS